jgi:hypothetical protein
MAKCIRKAPLPQYSARRGWVGGDSRTLYAFTDTRTGTVHVQPGGGRGKKLMRGAGGSAQRARLATRAEAEKHWQSPLHVGWKVRC